MKVLTFLVFTINAILFTSLIRSESINPNNIEWLDISHWNETDFSNLQKRGNYDSQIKPLSFYRGVDISSIISLENSGVRFYNSNGQEQDIFQILANIGVNCIRVRIWNSPKSANGKYYGGGNNDLEVAKTIGSRAAKYGLPLFVDFHYSDFWADPGKQTVPKEWRGFNLDKLVFEIYRFTQGCLEWLLQNGSLISMVQIGNETSCFMCGDKNMTNIMKMMNNGAKAVRDISKNILIALHFTNPEKYDNMLWYASQLDSGKVDYDVFATSYYPYWHGTTNELKRSLGDVANRYGKKVLIAEYSYPYTNAAKTNDGCYYGIVSSTTSGANFRYPISVDGQAQCIRDIYSTMKSIKNGIGAFYWEPAWIAPPARNDGDRKRIWEQYGSGWATTTASEYDSGANRNMVGASTWDNQAVFDQNGKALKSLSALGDGAGPINNGTNNNNNNINNNNNSSSNNDINNNNNDNNTNNNSNNNNINNNQNQNCFSIRLGFPCCIGNIVYYTDADGQWGFENGNWCGISNNNQPAVENCVGKNDGYPCCQTCYVQYTDDQGRWGVENGDWCGIKYSC